MLSHGVYCALSLSLSPTAKVTFTVMLPDNQIVELLGHVDKEQSHQVSIYS